MKGSLKGEEKCVLADKISKVTRTDPLVALHDEDALKNCTAWLLRKDTCCVVQRHKMNDMRDTNILSHVMKHNQGGETSQLGLTHLEFMI